MIFNIIIFIKLIWTLLSTTNIFELILSPYSNYSNYSNYSQIENKKNFAKLCK